MKTTLTLLAVLCMATLAQGAINVTSSAPVDIGGGLWSTTVSLTGDTATAFDGSFTGVLNQVKAFGALDTPTMTNVAFLAAGDQAKDTHFLLADADIIPVTAPAETTGKLGGVFGIQPAKVASPLALAQIVGPAGLVTLAGKASDAQGVESPVNALIELPEPATLSLLGLGVLALRRRK